MKPLEEMGRFSVVVVDPPWPLRKTGKRAGRDEVAYGDLGYKPMSMDSILALPIQSVCLDNAFVFLWTTQAYLPHAFDVMNSWGIRYRFTMVWCKNTGMKPFNYPYSNAEFIVVGAVGNPTFVDEKDFKAAFYGRTAGHSVKPEEFYDLLRRITEGPRLDVFGRRLISGFTSWGDEAPEGKYDE